MNYNVPMPSLGADMDSGKLMEWKIKPGDEIKKGQTIASVETTKSVVEIESFHNGKVLSLSRNIGEEIKVGEQIAVFDVPESEVVPMAEVRRPRISPAARKLAGEKNVPLEALIGSGKENQIELKDVEKYLEMKPAVAAGARVNLREAIANAMAKSKKEIPHYYLKARVGLNEFMTWIDQKNKVLPPEERLLVPAVLLRAVVMALKDFPQFNGYFSGEFEAKTDFNIGVAVALKEGGVMVPAILNAEKLSLPELNHSFQDLLIRTRKGELKNRELTEGSFTVTNVGDLGSDEVFGIIFPPQVALVGLGKIQKVPVVSGGNVVPGFVIDITLSADHRVTDGLLGSRFLAAIRTYLSEPEKMEESHEQGRRTERHESGVSLGGA